MIDVEADRLEMQHFLEEFMRAQDPNAIVRTGVSLLGNIQIVVDSAAFGGLEPDERDELVWPALREEFGARTGLISICVLREPQEEPLVSAPAAAQ